jgi:hypothetical protein
MVRAADVVPHLGEPKPNLLSLWSDLGGHVSYPECCDLRSLNPREMRGNEVAAFRTAEANERGVEARVLGALLAASGPSNILSCEAQGG